MNAPRDDADEAVIRSSGNVFRDLGIDLSPEDIFKIEIARRISNSIQERGLTQTQAAKRMGTDQSKVSAVLRGRLEGFSIARLMEYFLLLGHDIDIRVSKKYREHEEGRLNIRAA
jgi:predicted XRE-type DNA-binding protein